jgi:flavoprotein
MDHLCDKIQNDFPNFKVDAGPNSPFIEGPLQMGYYDFLLIAPATVNTVAKIDTGLKIPLLQMQFPKLQKERHLSSSCL